MDLDEEDYELLGYGHQKAYEAVAVIVMAAYLYRQEYFKRYYQTNRTARLAYQLEYDKKHREEKNRKSKARYAARKSNKT